MLRMFLLTALRNLLRHKLQTLINIFSLAIGLTVFGFAFLYVKQELSYDAAWPDAQRVHRLVVRQQGIPGTNDLSYTFAPAPVWTRLSDYFAADIETASRVSPGSARLADSDYAINTSLWFVDPPFLELFRPELVDGDLNRALSGPGFIAVEEDTAERLGLAGHVGERFTFIANEGQVEYELAAIYRLPRPVSAATNFSMLTLIHDYSLPLFDIGQGRRFVPWEGRINIWIKLRPGLETAAFDAQQPAFVQQQVTEFNAALGPERRVSDHLFYRWQPLRDIHFNPLSNENLGGMRAGDPARVAMFAIVGTLVLLVGCSNSVSLSLAAAIERRREIGVRKASGALPRDILRQQLGESLLLVLMALLPAIAALELFSPAFQALLPFVNVSADWSEYLLLAAIAGVVGLACGAYPALVLSSTRPQAVLRAGAQRDVRSGSMLRTLLVAAQFCLASMLLIGTSALYVQLAVARAQPLGFDASNTVLLFQNTPGVSLSAFSTELGKIPGVLRVIAGSNPPNANFPLAGSTLTLVRNTTDGEGIQVLPQAYGLGFIDMMGMRLLAGRDFDANRDAFSRDAGFADGQGSRVVINASAARQLGFASPADAVEQTLYLRMLNNQTGGVNHSPQRVIGVLEDSLYASLRRRPGPQMYSLMLPDPTRDTGNLQLEYADAVEATLQQSIQEVAQRVLGTPLSGMVFAEPQLAAAFRQEQNESKLLLICGAIALVLASFGLYGLAAFAIERQIKEVGVRKVMGAGVATIVGLYLWRFSRPIVFANLLAWPVAIYFILQWIKRFPYQMERAWLAPLCIGTMGAVLLIAMLTVSVITTRAATANPVRSLRYE